MNRFQLDHLRTFAAVIEQGTLEAAARELHITASAVSQRIKSMEEAAGRILLQRTNPARATTAGESALRLARQMRQLELDAVRELGPSPDGAAAAMALAVNADSLATWFLSALARVPAELNVCFDVHREDEQHSTDLLRSGAVMAAVTAIPEPVQGCRTQALGIMRYRAVASRSFMERWMPGGMDPAALKGAPVLDFDRKDDLQERFFSDVAGNRRTGPRHYLPASAEFAEAVRLGLGWGLLPEQQCVPDIQKGVLIELAPESPMDVPLYWQRWKISSPLLDQVSTVVLHTASEHLRPVPGAR